MTLYVDTNRDYRRLSSDTKQYRIRAMTVTDIPTVVRIDRTTWGDKSWSTDQFFTHFEDSLSTCWILEDISINDSVLGYGFQQLSDGVSHITNLCLRSDQRGRGLGGILLRHMIGYARWLDTSIVELEVDTSNHHAYALYYKHGFRITQVLQRYYSDIDDAYRMELIIAKFDERV